MKSNNDWLQRQNKINYAYIISLLVVCVFAMIIIALTSCKSRKPLVSTQTNTNRTSLTERYDSAHTISGDSAQAKLLLRCDSLGNVYLSELHTEQGRRINVELQLRGLQNQLDSALSQSPKIIYRNTPMLIDVDCKEDSFEVVIRGLRERIAYYEQKDEQQTIIQKVVPDYYKFCARGFYSLLALVLIALALLIWKNWAKIAAWFIKMYAKLKLF